MESETVSEFASETWRATLFGGEGELAFVQTVGDPPPPTISVPIVNRIRVVDGAETTKMEPNCRVRLFELIWMARPRAEYKEI